MQNEALLASCSQEERGGLACEYMGQSPELMAYIWACVTRLPDLPTRP